MTRDRRDWMMNTTLDLYRVLEKLLKYEAVGAKLPIDLTEEVELLLSKLHTACGRVENALLLTPDSPDEGGTYARV